MKYNNIERLLVTNRISNCKKCGGKMVYQYTGLYKCETCGYEELDDFGKVRKYLDEHGPTPAITISEATGVDRSVINTFLKTGRVEIPESSPQFIQCERCGTDIRYGRFCPACANILAGKEKKGYLVEDVGEVPKNATGKMRYLDKRKER